MTINKSKKILTVICLSVISPRIEYGKRTYPPSFDLVAFVLKFKIFGLASWCNGQGLDVGD